MVKPQSRIPTIFPAVPTILPNYENVEGGRGGREGGEGGRAQASPSPSMMTQVREGGGGATRQSTFRFSSYISPCPPLERVVVSQNAFWDWALAYFNVVAFLISEWVCFLQLLDLGDLYRGK